MGINFTLVGQLISFAVFIGVVMKFIWPPIMGAMEEREQRIKDGLSAAEQGHRMLLEAKEQASKELRAAKEQAKRILEKANENATQILVEETKQAKLERERLLALTQSEIEKEWAGLKQKANNQVADMMVIALAKLLLREPIDNPTHRKLIHQAIADI